MDLRNILIAIDGSKNSNRALDAGFYLAKQCNSKISVVYVVPFGARLASEGINRAAKEAFFKEGKKYLSSSEKKAKSKDIPFDSKILEGRNPGDAIVNYANKKNTKYDLIVLGSRGRSGLKEAFLGSVSNHVMHKSKVPVMVIK